MNKKTKLIYIIAVPVFSIITFLIMYYLFNWSFKKSIIISGGSAVAMVISDFIALHFAEKKRKKIDQESANSTNLNTP